MRDNRRVIITRFNTVKNEDGTLKIVPMAGHLIGAGICSVISIHRKIISDMSRQIKRKAEGRFVWWPNMEIDAGPQEAPTSRQYHRALARTVAKLEASAKAKTDRKARRAEKRLRKHPTPAEYAMVIHHQ